MSRVWICLNLICAATYFLHSSASSEGVTVRCRKPEEIDAGQSLTINCSVNYTGVLTKCNVTVNLNRNNITEVITFKEESPQYVLLNVSNVTKSDNWKVTVITDCGLPKSETIKVKVHNPHDLPEPEKSQEESKDRNILGVYVSLTIFIFVLLLFGIIFLCKKRKNIQGAYTRPDSSLSPDEC